jgi:hypothetical protein
VLGGNVNWEAIGAIGEILGAFAVVLTLLYLAVQVKYAKTAANDATSLNRANGVQAMLLAATTDDTLRASVSKAQGLGDYHVKLAEKLGLSVEEAERIDFYASYWFWVHWGQFASSNSKEGLDELTNIVNTFYRFPFMSTCWELSPSGKQIMDSTFVAFVDGVLAKEAT